MADDETTLTEDEKKRKRLAEKYGWGPGDIILIPPPKEPEQPTRSTEHEKPIE
jgi:hypothetical protein